MFYLFKIKYCFNPRTRVGCDATLSYLMELAQVSIHAPVWGATDEWAIIVNDRLFQSTHPCGVRQLGLKFAVFLGRFNPRTRVGCDMTL